MRGQTVQKEKKTFIKIVLQNVYCLPAIGITFTHCLVLFRHSASIFINAGSKVLIRFSLFFLLFLDVYGIWQGRQRDSSVWALRSHFPNNFRNRSGGTQVSALQQLFSLYHLFKILTEVSWDRNEMFYNKVSLL